MEKDTTRRRNFSKTEKSLVEELAAKYNEIIECKRTDSISLAEKQKTWEKIEVEFNSQNNGERATVKQLKAAYKNIKYVLKKNVANERLERFKTGGGPPPENTQETPLMSVLSPQMFSLDNKFDSSAPYLDISTTSDIDSVMSPIKETSCPMKKSGENKLKFKKNNSLAEFKKRKMQEIADAKLETEKKKQKVLDLKVSYMKAKILKLNQS